VAFASSSIVGSRTIDGFWPVVEGKRARAIPIGIADNAKDPAERIDSAVALIPVARDEKGIEVVGGDDALEAVLG
jgi:hypothetical protein